MKEVYTSFLKEIAKQRIQIETDIAMIERGLEEKECFTPIVDADKLLHVRGFLVKYMSVLAALVEEIELKERGKTERLVKPITISLSETETLLLLGALRVAAKTKIANDIDKGILEELLNRISKKVIEESEVK